MEEPEKKSSWDKLARELGASEPAERAAPIAPAAVRDPSTPPRPSKRDKETPAHPPARPKATAQDWDNLAAGLGIEPPPAPPAPPAPATPTRHREGTHVEAAKPATPRPPRSRPAPEPLEEKAESRPARPARPEPPRAEEPEPKPAAGGAVSLWHKIFGSPAEQAQKIAEVESEEESSAQPAVERPREERRERPERRPRHRGRRDERDSEREADTAERDDSWAPERPDAETVDVGEDARGGAAEEGEPQRGRRRRRRGGRGRRREGDGGETRAPSERSERREGNRSRRGRSGAGVRREREEDVWAEDAREVAADDDILEDVMAEPDGGDDTELDTEEAGAEPAVRGAAAASRNIPSWEEAIGFIVDTNLSTRSEGRRSMPKGSRSSGSSRGGRSRRRRGGKKQ